MRVLCVIPARGGSKSIPKKNIININGRPLIDFSIQQAKRSNCIDYIHVSTDSMDIANVSKDFGASCDFLRPIELSGDKIGTGEAIFHSLEELMNRGHFFDIVVELQPTYCLRGSKLIEQCINFLKENNDFDSIITCKKIETTEHPDYAIEELNNGFAKFGLKRPDKFARQYLRPVYACHGLVLASSVKWFLKNKTFYSDRCKLKVVNDSNRMLDINTFDDLQIVKMFIEKNPEYLL